MGREAGEWLVNESFVRSNVGKTMRCAPSPVITIFIGGMFLPFPVMGVKNYIVLPTLLRVMATPIHDAGKSFPDGT